MRSHKRTARQKKNAEGEPAKEEQENMRMSCRGFIIYKTFVLKDHLGNRYKKTKTQRQKDKEGYIMATLVQIGDNHTSGCFHRMVQFFSFSSVGDSLCREHQPAGSKQQIMDTNESKRVANTDKPRPVPSPVHQCMQF